MDSEQYEREIARLEAELDIEQRRAEKLERDVKRLNASLSYYGECYQGTDLDKVNAENAKLRTQVAELQAQKDGISQMIKTAHRTGIAQRRSWVDGDVEHTVVIRIEDQDIA